MERQIDRDFEVENRTTCFPAEEAGQQQQSQYYGRWPRCCRLIDTFPPTSAPATSRCYAKLSAAAAACWSILYFKWVAAAALHCSPPAAAAGRQEGGSLLLPALESIDLDSELLLEVQCEPAPARPGHVTLAAAERCTHPSSS